MSQAATDPRLARLSVTQVHAMLRAGIVAEGEPIELLDGLLVYKDRSAEGQDPMTIGEKHNLVVKLLARLDQRLAEHGCHMQTQGPVTLSEYDEPEPDGAVVRGEPRDYAERLPTARDVECVIEVADASLERDRTDKLAVYARARIAQYVIINLRDNTLHIHEQPLPDGGRYAHVSVVRAGGPWSLRTGTDAHLDVDAASVLP